MKKRIGPIVGVLTITAAFVAYLVQRQSWHRPGASVPSGENNEYVAAQSCAGCHRKIWDTYQQTGMARSFERMKPEGVGGDFDSNNTFDHAASDRHYTMYRRDGKFLQRRYERGLGGREDNALEKEIHFAIGSGNHARTFVHRTPDGKLFELPVTWYAEKGGHWAMSPGFDTARQPDFRRQMMYECVFCHTAYPELAPGADASGQQPLFRGAIPEGIDCQRCHGPGRRHIEAAGKGESVEAIRAAIVNPKRLAAERQLEVCMQCHLETTSSRLPHTILRFDRGAFSYRPGLPLSDFAIHFDHAPGGGHDDKFEIAHQAYRLRRSACFLQSKGQMTCTTCHDPHATARGELAQQRYNNACNKCHGKQLSKRNADARHTSASDCVSCHLPKRRPEDVVNVVMTDHYIQRNPPNHDPAVPLQERQETEQNRYTGEVVLYYPEKLPPTPENELYLAVAQVKQLNNLNKGIPRLETTLQRYPDAAGEFHFELAEAYAKRAESDNAIRSYREAIKRKPDFRPAWLGLGRSLGKASNLKEAVEVLEKASAMGPEDATILNDLALIYLSQARTTDAVRVLRKAIAVDPDHAEAHSNLAGAFRESGNVSGAEQEYRRAILAQPDFASARQHLATLLADRGVFAEAIHHYQKLVRQDATATVLVAYALALAGDERYRDALIQFQAAARLAPNLAEAHLGVADMLAISGKVSLATTSYLRALALNPSLGAAHLGLASALESQGKRAQAVSHLEAAARSNDATASQAAQQALQSIK